MKNIFVVFSLCLIMAATGCQTITGNEAPITRDNNEIINSRNRSEGFNVINPDRGYETIHHFGFVRHQRETAMPRGETTPKIAMYDPEILADTISKLSVIIPDVQDVATLVTDKYVLVAYNTSSENRFETADQVKRAAMSCVPRFYHVYVSDEPTMIDHIERFASQTATNDGIDEVLGHTITEMLKSPQGRRINASENENGEYDDLLNGYDNNDHNHHERLRNSR